MNAELAEMAESFFPARSAVSAFMSFCSAIYFVVG
jgi:hypothetical protein